MLRHKARPGMDLHTPPKKKTTNAFCLAPSEREHLDETTGQVFCFFFFF